MPAEYTRTLLTAVKVIIIIIIERIDWLESTANGLSRLNFRYKRVRASESLPACTLLALLQLEDAAEHHSSPLTVCFTMQTSWYQAGQREARGSQNERASKATRLASLINNDDSLTLTS